MAEIRGLTELLNPALVAELRRVELRSRRSIDADTIGRYRSAFRGSGLLFTDLREYQPGDDIKHIHWKASARTGKTFVKSYEEDRSLNILLLLDFSRSTLFGLQKTKAAKIIEFAALISMLARQNQDSIGMCLFSDAVEEYLQPSRKRSQFNRIILSLLRHRELRRGSDLASALRTVSERQKRRSVVFVVSDFYCPPYEEELKRLRYRHDVICALVRDPLDAKLPSAGLVSFFDAEKGGTVMLDTSSRSLQTTLAAAQERHVQSVSLSCRRAGADFLMLEDNALRPLISLMEQRTARIH